MPLCPKCGSEVAARDTHCMDCGEDLLAAKERERQVLRETSLAARTGGGGPSAAIGASAGKAMVGEKSEETRLRAFDQQEAERLAAERVTAWATGGIALVAAAALVSVGLNRMRSGGGFGELTATFSLGSLRELGFGVFGNATFLGAMLLGLGIAALLVCIGQVRMALATGRAIGQVRSNIKPEIVHVSTFTIAGLVVLAVFCPPVGLIIGAVMWLGRNPDLKGVGQQMFTISLVIMAAFGANMLAKVAEGLKHSTGATK